MARRLALMDVYQYCGPSDIDLRLNSTWLVAGVDSLELPPDERQIDEFMVHWELPW